MSLVRLSLPPACAQAQSPLQKEHKGDVTSFPGADWGPWVQRSRQDRRSGAERDSETICPV